MNNKLKTALKSYFGPHHIFEDSRFFYCFTAAFNKAGYDLKRMNEILAPEIDQLIEFEGIINTGIAVISNLSADIESNSSLIAKYYIIRNNIDKVQAIADIFERTKQNYQNIANQLNSYSTVINT